MNTYYSLPTSDKISVIVLAIISLIFLAYLILSKDTSKHDIEIDNIYQRIGDNDKLRKELNDEMLMVTNKENHYYDVFPDAELYEMEQQHEQEVKEQVKDEEK